MEACHEDDDSTNDALSNLRWDTHKANSADAVRNGRTPHGERNGMSKLTPDQIRLIRADHAAGGLSYERLAAKHQLGIATVFGIVKRSAWKHVSD
jgi:ribosome-binding protein aMBF1 (putative translation factor)